MKQIVVIGAGIVGASIAYHLARAGAAVSVIERGRPASGASGASFAWIGKGPTPPRPAQALLRESVIEDYRRLEQELPDLHVRWTGSVQWDDSGRDPESAGEGVVLRRDELAQLEPHLVHTPARAVFNRSDGALDPTAVVRALLAGAEEAGARVRLDEPVVGFVREGPEVTGVRTASGVVPADVVVIAAGADSVELCEDLGIGLPLAPSPAILVTLSAAPDVIRTLLSSDRIEVRQTDEGTFRAVREHHGETADQELHEVGREVLGRVRAALSGMDDVELTRVQVGVRPMPTDDDPVIGPLPGLSGAYVAVMHSGVTLAATLGRLVADDILDEREPPELAPLRPTTTRLRAGSSPGRAPGDR